MAGDVIPPDVRMVAVARLDDDVYVAIGPGEVNQMGGLRKVVSDRAGRTSMLAVADGKFLELVYSSRSHLEDG